MRRRIRNQCIAVGRQANQFAGAQEFEFAVEHVEAFFVGMHARGDIAARLQPRDARLEMHRAGGAVDEADALEAVRMTGVDRGQREA